MLLVFLKTLLLTLYCRSHSGFAIDGQKDAATVTTNCKLGLLRFARKDERQRRTALPRQALPATPSRVKGNFKRQLRIKN